MTAKQGQNADDARLLMESRLNRRRGGARDRNMEKPKPLALSPVAAALKGPKPRAAIPAAPVPQPPETGGPQGPEPTRYGDWERKGRCSDF
jgi:hypothetical protein